MQTGKKQDKDRDVFLQDPDIAFQLFIEHIENNKLSPVILMVDKKRKWPK